MSAVIADPAVASAFAAGRVPGGVSTAWLDETRDQPAIAAIIAVTVFTGLVVGCRLFSRWFVLKKFGYDDGLAALSLLVLIPFTVLCILLINMGSGRHYEYIQYVMTSETVELSEVLDFAAHIIYTTALVVCRLSGLAFYHRICGLHDEFLLAIRLLAGTLVASFLPQLFLLIFHCLPVTGLWPYDWQPGGDKYTCLQWGIVYSVNSSISLFCDLLLFGIPVAMIWILDLPPKRRVQLACILLPGILVIGISIARLILVIRGQWESDQSWSYNPMLAVEVSEIGATLMALSVPGIKPMFDRWVLRKMPASSTYGGGSAKTRSGTGKSKSKSLHGTPLRSLSLRPTHTMLTSSELTIKGNDDLEAGYPERENTSTEGIYVRVDFNLHENRQRDVDKEHQYIGTAR